MRTSGAETLSVSANIFVGQTEAPLMIRPYVGGLTKSELVAVMHEGDNLMYFARKEQCFALNTQLRGFKPRIETCQIYRIYPGGDKELLFPKDGVFSEKPNEGRQQLKRTGERKV